MLCTALTVACKYVCIIKRYNNDVTVRVQKLEIHVMCTDHNMPKRRPYARSSKTSGATIPTTITTKRHTVQNMTALAAQPFYAWPSVIRRPIRPIKKIMLEYTTEYLHTQRATAATRPTTIRKSVKN